MPLESLLELVEALRERIDEHGAALRQSEALTRYALIDPLLRGLGWDTEDPALVLPEYRLGRGYADYALLSNGSPVILVEAKKLGTPLYEAASQGIGYCIEDGIGYFAVTDGKVWEIYETHKMAPIADKLTVQFDLANAPAETCLKALALWRQGVIVETFQAGEMPIFQAAASRVESTSDAGVAQPTAQDMAKEEPRTNSIADPITTASGEWIPISTYSPSKTDQVPLEMRFPDGTAVPIQRWYMIVTEAVRWLYDQGHITMSNPQVRGARRLLVSDSPFSIDGRPFAAAKVVGPLHVETHGHRSTVLRNVRHIFRHTGQDPARFKVRIS